MKAKDVELGKVYRVKVSGKVQEVRLDRVNPHGGWDGRNVATKRPVRVRSPRRLRGLAAGQAPRSKSRFARLEGSALTEAINGASVEALVEAAADAGLPERTRRRLQAVARARRATKEPAAPLERQDKEPAAKTGPEAGEAKGAASREKAGVRKVRAGGLTAAVRVLAEVKAALKPDEIARRAVQAGYWQTKGKTPGATIGAAIIREIARRGKESRFAKTAPNTFALTPAGQPGEAPSPNS